MKDPEVVTARAAFPGIWINRFYSRYDRSHTAKFVEKPTTGRNRRGNGPTGAEAHSIDSALLAPLTSRPVTRRFGSSFQQTVLTKNLCDI
jgi:hypothetical protein